MLLVLIFVINIIAFITIGETFKKLKYDIVRT